MTRILTGTTSWAGEEGCAGPGALGLGRWAFYLGAFHTSLLLVS